MASLSSVKALESPLEASDIGSSVSRGGLLENKKQILVDMTESSFTKTEIGAFKKNVRDWYPFYENFGKNKVYPESSVFWRILTYIPYLKKISGFDTFEKLGKDAATKDIDNLTRFLKEDIPRKINEVNEELIRCRMSTDDKRNSL
ncbi:MAG: hypothetical protein K940chlam5_00359 [Candidatus Anoxychlamydiales bacterium]|nr:hypothetical protein [Candidatus Anoxychlamydiales bacterium]